MLFLVGGVDAVGDLLHLFGRELLLGPMEVDVVFGVHGDEVYVCVWHFESEYYLCYFSALEDFPYGECDVFGEYLHGGEFFVCEVEDVVYFPSWYDEGVSF